MLPKDSAFGIAVAGYRHRAKQAGLDFDLDQDRIYQLFISSCYYCGMPPSNLAINPRWGTEFEYSGIDRLDNSKGYIESNCVACCSMCNMAKNNHTVEEFAEWVIDVHNHFIEVG